jgi:hypothetical protein
MGASPGHATYTAIWLAICPAFFPPQRRRLRAAADPAG